MPCYILMGTELLSGKRREVVQMCGGDGCTRREHTECHRTVRLKMDKMVSFLLCIFYHNKKMKTNHSCL